MDILLEGVQPRQAEWSSYIFAWQAVPYRNERKREGARSISWCFPVQDLLQLQMVLLARRGLTAGAPSFYMVGWMRDHGGELGWSRDALELLVQVYQPRYSLAVAQALEKGTRANDGHSTLLHTAVSGQVAGCNSHPHKGRILKGQVGQIPCTHKTGNGNLEHGKPDGEPPTPTHTNTLTPTDRPLCPVYPAALPLTLAG